MDFNINDTVLVRLTPKGRAMHARNHASLCARIMALPKLAYKPPTEDANGWSEWQMWRLMEEFAEHCGNGMLPCFEQNTIRIVTAHGAPTPFTDQRARNGDQE